MTLHDDYRIHDLIATVCEVMQNFTSTGHRYHFVYQSRPTIYSEFFKIQKGRRQVLPPWSRGPHLISRHHSRTAMIRRLPAEFQRLQCHTSDCSMRIRQIFARADALPLISTWRIDE